MSKGVVVSLLWPKDQHVAVRLAQKYECDIASINAFLTQVHYDAIVQTGARCIVLGQDPYAPRAKDISTQFAQRWQSLSPRIEEQLTYPPSMEVDECRATTGAVARVLEQKMPAAMNHVDLLEQLRENETVVGLILNESEALAGKSAALWAKGHGVPVFVVSHGASVGEAYTVTADMFADYILFFGSRGTEPYADIGFPRERMIVTGNPAWDDFPALVQQRDAHRNAIHKTYDLDATLPLLVFATTWNAKLTALQDVDLFDQTTRAFLGACRRLADTGLKFNAIVKDRPPNAEFGAARVAQIGQEAGFDGYRYATGDFGQFIVSADLFVGYDTSAFVEAMMAGVPAINIWTPSSFLIGPAFGREDGIPMVRYDNPAALADVMATLMVPGFARAELLEAMRSQLPRFQMAVDGGSTERCAQAIGSRLNGGMENKRMNGLARDARYVWQELSEPRTAEQKGAAAQYYMHARHELLALLSHRPRFVLDVGCGGGATGAEIKRLYPDAKVLGIELNRTAADAAAKRVDAVLCENIEKMDFAAVGFTPGSIDLVLFPDVLEHLYDPWNVLKRIKPYLSRDAQVLSSIPNIRNLALVSELVAGNFDYVEEGLLDVTHIRFFTRKSVNQLFEQTGYRIVRVGANYDPRISADNLTPGATCNLDLPRLSVKNATPDEFDEFRTIQFLVDATPA